MKQKSKNLKDRLSGKNYFIKLSRLTTLISVIITISMYFTDASIRTCAYHAFISVVFFLSYLIFRVADLQLSLMRARLHLMNQCEILTDLQLELQKLRKEIEKRN